MAGSVGLPVVFARLPVKDRRQRVSRSLAARSINVGSWARPVSPQDGELPCTAIVTAFVLAIAQARLVKPGPTLLRQASAP